MDSFVIRPDDVVQVVVSDPQPVSVTVASVVVPVSVVMIEGPQGLRGLAGTVGATGPQGAAGSQGAQGIPGERGLQGNPGEAGPAGPVGATGSTGSQGVPGVQGERGLQGLPGERGERGLQGIQGIQGERGERGETGATGPVGATGNQGTAGVSLDIQGSVANYASLPTNAQPGDAWIVLSDGKLYYRDATGFPPDGQGVPFQGPQGIQGIPGERGLTGNTGSVGPVGPAGATGAAGERGLQGIPGERGLQGIPGEIGPAGPAGAAGATGSQGVPGIQGAKGDTGAIGPTGPIGATGPAGTTTWAGLSDVPSDLVYRDATQTLSGKILTSPVVDAPSGQDSMVIKQQGSTKFTFNRFGELFNAVGYGIYYDNNIASHAFSSTGDVNITSGVSRVGSYDVSINPGGSGRIKLLGTVEPRAVSIASSATPAINTDATDVFIITALAENVTSMTTSLTGTPVDGQKLLIRIKGAAARTISWGASFISSGVATLPTLTVAGRTHTVGLIWDAAVQDWVCVASDVVGY